MKILNIILSLLIALMAGSCVYPEDDVIEDVSVSISGDADESGITVYGKLDSGETNDVSECGFELFHHGEEISSNKIKVTISDFRHYYNNHNQYGDLRDGSYSCRAYVIIGGVKIYSDEYRIHR